MSGWPATRPLLLSLGFVATLLAVRPTQVQRPLPPTQFGALVASLSEPAGYFDTDNLISNERSYLAVLSALRQLEPGSGAYVGVGPDQNFSYIAALRPSIAFIVDIRRDNLLLHLVFKALFAISESRAEYLANLLGRPVPSAAGPRETATLERLTAHVDRGPADSAALASLRQRRDAAIRGTGVQLSDEDFGTIERFHQRFIEDGLDLRFQSTGRPPQYHYPTYRELLLETDADGGQMNYLASDEAFRVVKALQGRDLIVPVVGDLAGPTALGAIGRLLAARGEALAVLYASNVEFYLYGQGRHGRFVSNLRQMPRTADAVVIRSVFGRYRGGGRPGDGSTSHLERLDRLLRDTDAGLIRSYGQLVGR
jgi:hypothetical protein